MAAKGDSDKAFAAIACALDGFTAGGLNVEIKTMQDMGPGSLKLIGTIYKNAIPVGRLSRDIIEIGDRWRAFHMAFELDTNVRGGPFRDAFFQHAESVYREHGIDDIRVSAEKIGSYLWAKEGFRFMGDEASKRKAETELWQARGRLLGQAAVERSDLPQTVFEEIDAKFAAVASGKRAPLEPQELAKMGDAHIWVSGHHTLWLGKEMLIDWAWNGIKDL